MNHPGFHRPSRQRGVTLLLGLLLTSLLGLLGLAAVSDAALQERIAGNEGENLAARHSAQSALEWAEDWLLSRDGVVRPEPCASDCGPQDVVRALGVYPASPEGEPAVWWSANAHPDGFDPAGGGQLAERSGSGASPGLWIVEEVAYLDPAEEGASGAPVSWYRVLARSASTQAGPPVVLEAVFVRPWGDGAWADPLPSDPSALTFCLAGAAGEPCGRRAWRVRR